jgi:hypothetical protein
MTTSTTSDPWDARLWGVLAVLCTYCSWTLSTYRWSASPSPRRQQTDTARPRKEKPMNLPEIVSRDEWVVARKRLLASQSTSGIRRYGRS